MAGPTTEHPFGATDTDPAEDFGGIVDAFLTEAPITPERSPGTWGVELLMMGHLPVRARPWASQYAAALAAERPQPVALVRIEGGFGSVELFGIRGDRGRIEPGPTFSAAIARAREIAGTCLVQLDESAQHRVARTGRFDAMTLLVGGNDAAVVGAYRTLKSLAGTGSELPDVRVAVMGCDEDESESIVAKLREAAAVFLNRNVDASVTVTRMGPTGAVHLYSDRTDKDETALLEEINALPEERAEPGATKKNDRPSEVPQPRVSSPVLEPKSIPVPAPTAPASSIRDSSDEASALPVSEASSLPAGEAHAKDDPRQLLTGLESLDIECPEHEGIWLARDSEGRLRVVAHASPSKYAAALAGLRWARVHAALIARAAGTSAELAPSLDLIVDTFDDAVLMRSIVAPDTRLYVRVPAHSDCGAGLLPV